jgi:uncharacterized protein (UPF0261 family)
MVQAGKGVSSRRDKATVAVTALGNTEAAAHRAIELLQESGFQTVAFHASGAGGSAMEELIRRGMIDAVLDLTLHELTEEVLNVGAYVPVTPGRLDAACRKGIPVVAATGAMEYLCFGPKSSIPAHLQDRVIYMHNPYNANLKITHQELVRVAEVLAERLNRAAGPAALFVPRLAWSVYGSEGGPFHDPEGIEVFIDTLRRHLEAAVDFNVLEYGINDGRFASACVSQLKLYLTEEAGAAPGHSRRDSHEYSG